VEVLQKAKGRKSAVRKSKLRIVLRKDQQRGESHSLKRLVIAGRVLRSGGNITSLDVPNYVGKKISSQRRNTGGKKIINSTNFGHYKKKERKEGIGKGVLQLERLFYGEKKKCQNEEGRAVGEKNSFLIRGIKNSTHAT